MKIKVEQFCSLATSPSWQAWLYQFNNAIYKDFMDGLQKSRNCSENRTLMKRILDVIDDNNGADSLHQFLHKQYPHVLVENTPPSNSIFPNYIPGILTFPHRKIFKNLSENETKKFLDDKGQSDYIKIGNTVYVEYLEKHENDIASKIKNNWLIHNYRKNKI